MLQGRAHTIVQVSIFFLVVQYTSCYSYFLFDASISANTYALQDPYSSNYPSSFSILPFYSLSDSGLYGIDCLGGCKIPGTFANELLYRTNSSDCLPLRKRSTTTFSTCYSFNSAINNIYTETSRQGFISAQMNQIPGNTALENVFYFSAWIKPSSSMNGKCGSLINFMRTSSQNFSNVYLGKDMEIFGLYFNTCSTASVVVGNVTTTLPLSTTIAYDVWSHILFNFDGRTGSIQLYINGALSTSATNTQMKVSFPYAAGTSLYTYYYTIGARQTGISTTLGNELYTFIGAMDQMMLHTGVASTSLVSSINGMEYTCDGVAQSDVNVCGAIGTCTGFNKCTCTGSPGKWSGPSCSYACSNRGISSPPEQYLSYIQFITGLFVSASQTVGSIVQITIDYSLYVNAKQIQYDCSDVRVFFSNTTSYDGIEIPRVVTRCGLANSTIAFQLQPGTLINSTTVWQYTIKYGGPNKFYNSSTLVPLPNANAATPVLSYQITQRGAPPYPASCACSVLNGNTYTGLLCNAWTCGGIDQANSTVCGGQGMCVDPGGCRCYQNSNSTCTSTTNYAASIIPISQHANGKTKLTLTGAVTRLSGYASYTTTWTVVRPLPSQRGYFDISNTTLVPQRNTTSLVIMPNTLTEDASYILTMTVLSSSGQVYTSANVSFTCATPPSSGQFIVSPTSGTTLVTRFVFNLPNWISYGGALQYRVAYLDSTGTEVSLSSYQTNSTVYNAILPPGNPVTIIGYVRDSFGSETSTTQTVAVSNYDDYSSTDVWDSASTTLFTDTSGTIITNSTDIVSRTDLLFTVIDDNRSPSCAVSCVNGVQDSLSGACSCNVGWTGVDCSLDSTELTQKVAIRKNLINKFLSVTSTSATDDISSLYMSSIARIARVFDELDSALYLQLLQAIYTRLNLITTINNQGADSVIILVNLIMNKLYLKTGGSIDQSTIDYIRTTLLPLYVTKLASTLMTRTYANTNKNSFSINIQRRYSFISTSQYTLQGFTCPRIVNANAKVTLDAFITSQSQTTEFIVSVSHFNFDPHRASMSTVSGLNSTVVGVAVHSLNGSFVSSTIPSGQYLVIDIPGVYSTGAAYDCVGWNDTAQAYNIKCTSQNVTETIVTCYCSTFGDFAVVPSSGNAKASFTPVTDPSAALDNQWMLIVTIVVFAAVLMCLAWSCISTVIQQRAAKNRIDYGEIVTLNEVP